MDMSAEQSKTAARRNPPCCDLLVDSRSVAYVVNASQLVPSALSSSSIEKGFPGFGRHRGRKQATQRRHSNDNELYLPSCHNKTHQKKTHSLGLLSHAMMHH
jgi:hypothetical protein